MLAPRRVRATRVCFEVTLKLKARAGTETTALFLIEMDYSGLFHLQGFSQADIEPILLIECPRILFPFARRIIADILSRRRVSTPAH